jgi:hypothetical protein
MDPGSFQYQYDLLAACWDKAVRRKYWEDVIPTKLGGVSYDKIVSRVLFDGTKSLHEIVLRKAGIHKRVNVMLATGHEAMILPQFWMPIFITDLSTMETMCRRPSSERHVNLTLFLFCCSVHGSNGVCLAKAPCRTFSMYLFLHVASVLMNFPNWNYGRNDSHDIFVLQVLQLYQ